jgi:hypothetical protein
MALENIVCPFFEKADYSKTMQTQVKIMPCGMKLGLGLFYCEDFKFCIYYLYYQKTGKIDLPKEKIIVSEMERILNEEHNKGYQ